jgi:chain length determinant protein (polysaccharide antigen chain regulator)
MTDKESTPHLKRESTQDYLQPPEDGIRLVDILEVIIRKKKIVLFIAFISTLISVSYSLSAPPVYKASIRFMSPSEISSPLYVIDKSSKDPWDQTMASIRKSIYTDFLKQMQSYNHQLEVFENGGFLKRFASDNTEPALPEKILSQISIKKGLPGKKQLFEKEAYAEMLGSKPEAMADFLNSLSQATIKKIQSQASALAQGKTGSLAKELDYLNRELAIARKLQIKDNNFKHIVADTMQPKWFLYGEKALVEEINRAQSILNDTPLKPSDLQNEKSELIETPLIEFEVAIISQPSIPPTTPIKPRKLLIISIGVLMGIFLGIIIAFISSSLEYLSKERESTPLK